MLPRGTQKFFSSLYNSENVHNETYFAQIFILKILD